jgi:tight adherence protein B
MFVMAMPPLLGLVFYQSDPEFMSPLFSTTIGWIVISLILALEVIAFFVIMKIVKIQV